MSKGSAAVQASVALKSGQSAYFAVYNPTSTAASFSVTVDSCTLPCPTTHIARMKLADTTHTTHTTHTQQRVAVRTMVTARRRCG
jgi:hypothetical protein